MLVIGSMLIAMVALRRTKSGFEQSQQGSPLTTPDDAMDM
jgi:hypothetical protein